MFAAAEVANGETSAALCGRLGHDDRTVHVGMDGAVIGIPAGLHERVFPRGGHGFGIERAVVGRHGMRFPVDVGEVDGRAWTDRDRRRDEGIVFDFYGG